MKKNIISIRLDDTQVVKLKAYADRQKMWSIPRAIRDIIDNFNF